MAVSGRNASVRVGGGSGFWGDAFDPALELAERGRLDYLCFDFLAELTMALLQRAKAKDPSAGYVTDMVGWFTRLAAPARANGTVLVCNGGGVNPRGGAEALAASLRRKGLTGTKIAVVSGDDMLDRLDELKAAGVRLTNTSTGDENIDAIRSRIVSANVYLGSDGIIESLRAGADMVVTGRVTDSAVFIGPIMHRLGWSYDQPDLVASAITVGHVLECAAGCTGGMSSRFDEMPRMGEAGFPIADIDQDGTATITKLAGTGGHVDQFTVKEHLVYEIGDPRAYATPDGIADFTAPRIEEVGPDRVRVSGMRGKPRPDKLKLLIGYSDGWIGEGMMMFPWPRALARARKAEETLRERFTRMGLKASAMTFDYVGVNMLHGPAAPWPERDDLNEVGLRVAVKTQTREEAEKVRRACTHLWIMGPGGTSFGVPMKPRPALSLWPTLVSRELVPHKVEYLES
jgi:hypothetical protein